MVLVVSRVESLQPFLVVDMSASLRSQLPEEVLAVPMVLGEAAEEAPELGPVRADETCY